VNILALTKYPYEGPSSRYRFYNYRACFEKQGIEMRIKPFFSKAYFVSSGMMRILVVLAAYLRRLGVVCTLLLFPRRYDLLLVEYELFPYFPAWFEYLLHKRGVKYIVDYDDAIFHKYDMSNNLLIKRVLQKKIAKVMGYAEHVIVCNSYLETYAKKYNAHTFRLPTVVLLDTYKEQMQAFQKEEDVFVVGWVGSRTTSIYVLEILPAIKRFVEVYPAVRFDLLGFDRSLLSREEAQKCHINIIDWNEESEIAHILAFDVGIMPLVDDAWSRGKCGFKLVQYMSCKKPVIASPVGMNCSLVKEGENGLLVKTTDEWFEAFERLYLDETLRVKMGENNYAKIEDDYHHGKNCQKYGELLKAVVFGYNETKNKGSE
jgi:glycosyltransferase involved in cell wall biosynthesis